MWFKNKLYVKILMIIYTCLLAYWMIWGFGRTTHSRHMYNLIPFSTIRYFLEVDHFNTRTWVINLLGNVGVFVPFGILIPMVFKSKLLKIISISLIGILVLESTQLMTRKGTFDVDDFILNTIGVIIGYVLYIIIAKQLQKS